MKKILTRYFMIFFAGVIISFLGVLAFHGLQRQDVEIDDAESDLAFLDLESGELIPFPEMERSNQGSVKNLCIRNKEGQILFWGELDESRSVMTGNILMPDEDKIMEEERYPIAIINRKSEEIYFLSKYLSTIQTGEYYITFDEQEVQTEEGEEMRYNLSVHYCPN